MPRFRRSALLLAVLALLALVPAAAQATGCDDCGLDAGAGCCPPGCSICLCCAPLVSAAGAGAGAPQLLVSGMAATAAGLHPLAPAPRGVFHVPKLPSA